MKFPSRSPAAGQYGKVPAVTLTFWLVKIAATTLGETGGDTLSMSLGVGYLASTLIFALLFAFAVSMQIRAQHFNPWIYWTTIVATTTVGTTLADFFDRSLGIGYAGGSSALLACLLVSFALWYRIQGSVSVATVATARVECFYWLTVMLSQTLGTALGDWTADSAGFGYAGSALIFGSALALIALFQVLTKTLSPWPFWAVFILTRPLGAVLGDWLDKPVDHGGLALSRAGASLALLAFVAACLVLFPQRAIRIDDDRRHSTS